MPLYDFRHHDCPRFDALVPWTTQTLPCPTCGGESKRLVCAPQRTATLWGDTQFGIHGRYDTALQRRVSSHAEVDSILESRGLVRASDVGGDAFFEKHNDKLHEENAVHKEKVDRWMTARAKHDGDDVAALAEAFPAKELLAEQYELDRANNTV